MVEITHHALKKYRERIDSSQADDVMLRVELRKLYSESKTKHLKKAELLQNKKKTTYVVNDKCIFIVSGKNIVTVLTREQVKARNHATSI